MLPNMKTYHLSIALLLGAALFAQAPAAGTAKTAPPVAAKTVKHKGGPTQNATAADIADAKSKGMVWVNTSTRVYHKDGEFFGATKQGKFMTEADAQKAGFHAAKQPKQPAFKK